MSDEQILAVIPKIRTTAVYWVARWAWHHRATPLVDDCVSVGIEVILRRGLEDRRVWWEVRNAIQDEIARWLYGVERCSGPRVLTIRLSLDALKGVPVEGSAPDVIAEARIMIRRIVLYLTETRRTKGRPLSHAQRQFRERALWVWQQLVINGALVRTEYEALGWNANKIFDARQLLRRLALDGT